MSNLNSPIENITYEAKYNSKCQQTELSRIEESSFLNNNEKTQGEADMRINEEFACSTKNIS